MPRKRMPSGDSGGLEGFERTLRPREGGLVQAISSSCTGKNDRPATPSQVNETASLI